MVEETFKYAATPNDAETATAAWADIQTCREMYNYALTQEYHPRPDYDKPSYRDMQNKITDWKETWPEWSTAYSKCLQMAVRRIKQSESELEPLQTRGYDVGRLKWKAPREFRSIVYNQSGFDVDHNTDYELPDLDDLLLWASQNPNPHRERLRSQIESGEFAFDRH